MEIEIKQLAASAKTFFDNYSSQSLEIKFLNGNLLGLRQQLDWTTEAIKAATEQSKVTSGQIRDNVVLLQSAIDRATQQAKESSWSAAKLSKSLNVITFCLVGVGILQILVSLWHH